jgi:hypothetical protein
MIDTSYSISVLANVLETQRWRERRISAAFDLDQLKMAHCNKSTRASIGVIPR